MGLGGLWKIHVGVILLVISGVVGSVLTLPARAQDDMPEATISALQTRVSELETEVAALLTPAASATSAPDEP